MKKAAFVLSIVAVTISAATLALFVLELLFGRTKYIDGDEI